MNAPQGWIGKTFRRINDWVLYQQNVQYSEDFFVYPLSFGNIASLATAPQQSITIQADSHFEWVCSTWSAIENGATAPFPESMILPINILLTDGGSGRQLMNAPVCISSIAGRGELPFYLPIPRIFLAKSQVQFQATSFDPAAQWNNVTFNLIGRKIFESGKGTFPR